MGTPVGSGKGEAKCTDCPCGERLEKEDGPGRSREDRVGRAASGGQQESQPGPGGVLSMGGSRVRGTDAVPGWGSRQGASQISGALGGSTPAPPALVSLGPGPGGKGPRAPGCLVRARIEWAVPPRLTHGFHWSYGMAQGWGGGGANTCVWTCVGSRPGLLGHYSGPRVAWWGQGQQGEGEED